MIWGGAFLGALVLAYAFWRVYQLGYENGLDYARQRADRWLRYRTPE